MAALAFWLKAKTIIELSIFVLSIFGLGKTGLCNIHQWNEKFHDFVYMFLVINKL